MGAEHTASRMKASCLRLLVLQWAVLVLWHQTGAHLLAGRVAQHGKRSTALGET